MSTPDLPSDDPPGRRGRPRSLLAPLDLIELRRAGDGLPVAAPPPAPAESEQARVDRRRFLITTSLAVLSLGAAVRGNILGERNEVRLAEAERTVRGVLGDIFPHFRGRTDWIGFHPNADNQWLRTLGVGGDDASVAAHLEAGTRAVDLTPVDDLFAPPRHAGAVPRNDLDVYSYTTLREAHAFRAALSETAAPVVTPEFNHECVHRGFDHAAPNVIVGSPTGNRLAAAFRGQRRRRQDGRRRELVHEGIPGLAYPFEFALDADAHACVRPSAAPAGADARPEYAWSVYREPAGGEGERTYYTPERGRTCYFTISVVPNFWAPGAFWNLPPVVLLEGCTPLGTSGIGCLVDRGWAPGKRLLTDLHTHLASRGLVGRYWQALFAVTGCGGRDDAFGQRETYATDLVLVGVEPIYPTEVLREYLPRALEEARTVRRVLASGAP